MNFLITFIVLSIINVILSTVRSITTIKSGKVVASIVSGGYFAFYNIMLVYTVADFPMVQKCIITFCCNLTGVFIVKLIEEKMRKDRLWKVEMTVPFSKVEYVCDLLDTANIPHSYIFENTGRYVIYNIYCSTQKQSIAVKKIINKFNAKYFVSESKIL